MTGGGKNRRAGKQTDTFPGFRSVAYLRPGLDVFRSVAKRSVNST